MMIRKYALKRRIVEEAYYDGEGRPCLNINGCPKSKTTYTSRREITKKTYYRTDGRRIILPNKGYASFENTYVNGKYLTSTT